MREAKIIDNWRNVYKKKYKITLDSFSYEDVSVIGTGSITFKGGVTAICGGNGVGKSTLIDLLVRSLQIPHSNVTSISQAKLGNCKLKVGVTKNDASLIINSSINENEYYSDITENITVTCINPALRYSAVLYDFFDEMTNIEELLEAHTPKEYDKSEIEEISFLVGKDYESCDVYELDEFSDKTEIPYFRVSCDGITYGSETMGFGELSLHVLYWQLNRLQENSILLIEEPENGVSPRSQRALVDLLAKYSIRRSIWTIITTHSSAIINRIPLRHIRLLSRQNGNVDIIDSPTIDQLKYILAVPPSFSGAILVEDIASRYFTLAILRKYAPSYLKEYEIVSVDSDSTIDTILKKFPSVNDWLKIVGIYDGDMRHKYEVEISGNRNIYKWPYRFLPGDQPPEKMLQAEARSKSALIATLFEKEEAHIRFVLGAAEGLDHHDWFIEISKQLNVSQERLMEVLFRAWIDNESNERIISEWIEDLANIL